jgi:uncharacterized protein (TIGR02118 family)
MNEVPMDPHDERTFTKLVFCVRRHPSLSVEQFQRYWLDEHGPLVRSLWQSGRFPGMVRYVQSHTDHAASEATTASRGAKPPYDGITEVWFDPALQGGDDATRAASAEAGKILLADESTFIDFADSAVFMTREHTIFPLP